MLKQVITLAIFLSVFACGEPPDSSTVDANDVVSAANASADQGQSQNRRQAVSNPDVDLTCMQQCGQEARGTVYADCLDEGGNRQECGTSGRQWYRECLETRCDEAAVQLDDCRTECRITAKQAHVQCLDGGTEAETCREQKNLSVQSCIERCE